MNNNQKLFLKLISSALSGEKYVISPDECDYEALQNIAVHNSCLPLLYQGAVNCSLPTSSHWKQVSSYSVIDSYRKLQIEAEIIGILNQNGIRSCVLKGSSVALNYPNPLIRTMGDIDLLVDEENYEKAILLFAPQKVIDDNRHGFHVGFNYKKTRIEIHKQITEGSATLSPVLEFLKDAMGHIELKNCDGFCVPVLSAEYQAVSLLEHMLRHFRDNEFVFRMFCDWLCFVKNIPLDVWNDKICSILEKINLIKFADALNKSAGIYMDLDLQPKIKNDVDNEVCGIMIDEFLSIDKSNMTTSINTNIGAFFSSEKVSSHNKIVKWFMLMNDIAQRKYKLARHKVFLPIFWLLIPTSYIVNVILGKRNKVNLNIVSNSEWKRKKIYEALNL